MPEVGAARTGDEKGGDEVRGVMRKFTALGTERTRRWGRGDGDVDIDVRICEGCLNVGRSLGKGGRQKGKRGWEMVATVIFVGAKNDDLPDLSDEDGSFRDTSDWAISSQYIEISMEFIWK